MVFTGYMLRQKHFTAYTFINSKYNIQAQLELLEPGTFLIVEIITILGELFQTKSIVRQRVIKIDKREEGENLSG